ncbi:MAG: ABC transporter ATP-binding protein [Deinococcus sp.]|nr:ABC transporter ATP-binding protein [Deinococcus sp.]MCL5964499.1 ABC transporter ATP-binding protein [Deinococcus sp.]
MQNAVELKNVSCVFGTVHAVDHISLEVLAGEFFSLLGPSGSGKTTCLRLIAGFERPSSGSIVLLGKDAASLPPYAREVNTVFQDYALFPHMSVLDNVAYALMVRGIGRLERHRRALELLEMVKLRGMEKRRPAELSGGQRQRVALARALVNKPRILLLDEPLGALDLKLREEMQIELKSLQRQLGITFVYVTHDQSEALSMSDRVAVFNRGRIEQLDSPKKLYEYPETEFVARFVGSANVLAGKELGLDGGKFAIRPERIRIEPGRISGTNSLVGRLIDVHFLGSQTRYEVTLVNNSTIRMTVVAPAGGEAGLEAGSEVTLTWNPGSLRKLREGEA